MEKATIDEEAEETERKAAFADSVGTSATMLFQSQLTYCDHSHITDDDKDLKKLLSKADREGVKGTDQTFPVKLHQLLSTEELGFSHIVSWQPHGRSFIVKKHTEFVEKVLPCCFRQTKFASFQRQLNLYGFRRISQGPDKGGYFHELFLRGRSLLALKMQRTKVKGTGARKASSPETEPDFYSMPFVYESTTMSPPAVALPEPLASVSSQMSEAAHVVAQVSPATVFSVKPASRVAAAVAKTTTILGFSASAPSSLASPVTSLPGKPPLQAPRDTSNARRIIMTQLMENENRLHNLRECNMAALTAGWSTGASSSGWGMFAASPGQNHGPLHLNGMGMACACACPAF